MGSMAVAAMADDHGMSTYGPADSSISSRTEQGMDQGMNESNVGEIREPVETGALPDRSVKVDSEGWVNMDVSVQNESPDLRGLPNIQSGE
jgi:hypothetical protein